jgi:DNA-binding transcriptional LysR family regulator
VELRHLRYFLAVAEELHFGRAARRLAIAQPPVSQQIRKLEDELGFRLFERTRPSVRLTESGRAFVDVARKVLGDLQAGVDVARAIDSGQISELRIGIVGLPPSSLVAALVTFRSASPHVRTTVTEFSLEKLLSAIYDGRIDIGCFRQWMIEPPPDAVQFDETSMSVALVRGSAEVPHEESMPLRALASTPFVSLNRSYAPGYHDRLMRACTEAGFVPKIVAEAASVGSMLYLVMTGAGAALMPYPDLQHPMVSYRKITDPEIRVPLVFLRAPGARPAALDAFTGVLLHGSGA